MSGLRCSKSLPNVLARTVNSRLGLASKPSLGILSSETSKDIPEETSEETSDVEEESFGSEAGTPSPRRDAQRERLVEIFVPARI
jgi:hypothetical protein